jgi:hypothetical protein
LVVEHDQANIKKAHREDLVVEHDQAKKKKAHREDRESLIGIPYFTKKDNSRKLPRKRMKITTTK